MWTRTIDGLQLTFHLAGINNQNFLMRDDQTGSFWQQINGLAVSGPLAGRQLTLVHADELSFTLWKAEEPGGTVLNDVARYVTDYSPKNWDVRMAKVPTVISFATPDLKDRDIMLGVRAFGVSRAFPYQAVLKEKLIEDRVGTEPVLVVLGPDNRSVRVFKQKIAGVEPTPQFYRIDGGAAQPLAATAALLMDASTGSQWSFQGCAVAGKEKGFCLEPVEVIKDYWFDWRNYNPQTTVYGLHRKARS